MASTPDSNPDSPKTEPSDDIERVSPDTGRGTAESPAIDDDAGSEGGTSGTGGTNHRVDRDITS